MSAQARSLTLIVACQVGAMSLWFSASAAVPPMIASGELSAARGAWMTGAVQLGFVCGTLTSATLGLADRLDPRRIFFLSALGAAAANALLLVTGFSGPAPLLLRFLTGAMLAGVYPIGLKLAASWSRTNLGLLMGSLVGALTLGSALPSLFNWAGGVPWSAAVGGSTLASLLAACGVLYVSVGPNVRPASSFSPRDAWAQLARPPVRLVNIGYLGHMWELYAMWAWIGSFMLWVLQGAGWQQPQRWAALLTFLVIGSGAVGSVVAGLIADRVGRARVTMAAMATSGACAAIIGPASGLGPGVATAVAMVWGISVIADSAQFSAALTEVTDPRLVGTMLTLQTCFGFLLTFVSIQLVSLLVGFVGWEHVFLFLTIGPLVGVAAMYRFAVYLGTHHPH